MNLKQAVDKTNAMLGEKSQVKRIKYIYFFRLNKEFKQARRRAKANSKSGRKNRRKSGRGRKGQRHPPGRKNGGRRRRRQRGQKKRGQMRQRKSLSTFLR